MRPSDDGADRASAVEEREEAIRPWVLFAEDNDDDALLTVRCFRRWRDQYRLVRAVDGAMAIETISHAKTPPRLVVLDLKMPRASGFDVLRSLMECGERHFPAIVLSSSSLEEDRRDCEALGADGFFTKPVDFEEYLVAVQSMFARYLG